MKILLVFRVQKGFDFQSKVVFGGIEKFAKQIYDLFPDQVKICEITQSDTKSRNTPKKIKSAISYHSPDIAIINEPSHSYFKPFIELGVPLISVIHEPMVGDVRFLDLGVRLNSYMASGVHVYFVSELQHRFHSKMSKRIKGVDIKQPKGFIHSSYISNDFVVSKEQYYDVGTIGRMDQLKNPFFIHKKSEGTGLKSLVMSSQVNPDDFKPGHPIANYQNKNLDWTAPQTTILGLPHNEVLQNMSKCKTFVSTWTDESWGITTLEALGSGVPAMLVTNTPTDRNMGNSHASEVIPVSPDHYMKIPKKISKEDFKEIAVGLGNISYDKRIEIAEMTREKHSEENYKRTWERMFNALLDENKNKKTSHEKKETSTGYDNLVATMEEYEKVEKPKKTEKQPDYPFKLEVHIFNKGHCNRFAETIGKALSSNRRRFVYNDGKRVLPKNATFTELRSNPISKKITHKTRLESQYWRNTVDFSQDAFVPYITFTVTFRTREQHAKFAKRVKQKITLNKKSIRFPQRRMRVWKYNWVSQWKDCNPKYPVYIVSKGRADSRLTAKTFEKCNIPYYIVIEPQEYDEYAFLIDPKKILTLPFSNHGDGPGRARNWCWDHSLSNGFKRHWVCDDNIDGFTRLHRGRRHPVADGGMFRVIEEFVDRYKNVPIAGPQYRFHALETESYPPFVLNTRIYSCLLIENSCEYRWRGRYNEDTIICLDVLKAGHCTMLFNNLLQNKIVTQAMKGGNTDEFYDAEGTYKKSLMLEAEHPDVAKVVWRYNRWHHDVDYKPFKANKPIYVDGYDPKPHNKNTEYYPFKLEKI